MSIPTSNGSVSSGSEKGSCGRIGTRKHVIK
jgi:hypothetical protein